MVAQSVEALRYKPEGCRFDSRGCHQNFFYWYNPSGSSMSLGLTQPLTEGADNLTTFMCQVSWKWKPQPPVQGLLSLYLDKKLRTIIHTCTGSYFNYIITNESLHKALIFSKSRHFLCYATLKFTTVYIWDHLRSLPDITMSWSTLIPHTNFFTVHFNIILQR
jgi:hypothetical protein